MAEIKNDLMHMYRTVPRVNLHTVQLDKYTLNTICNHIQEWMAHVLCRGEMWHDILQGRKLWNKQEEEVRYT